jgi:uncharacterized protein (DUF1697 family)
VAFLIEFTMETYIALLRGINVSGQKMIKMTDLTALLSEINFQNIRTYIQSGNLIFEYPATDQKELTGLIERKILHQYKFDVPVVIRHKTDLLKIKEYNPFLKRNENIDKLHVTFLDNEPSNDLIEKAKETAGSSDEFEVIGREVFVFCPDGYGNTKLNNTFFEKKFKTKATTRNWKTVVKLGEI